MAGVVGALSVVLSLLIAPLAFGPVQFRLGEVLKPPVIEYPATIPALAVGVGLVNLLSPVAGGLELVLMPVVNLAGGVLCWAVARRGGGFGTYAASALLALVIAASVATVLHFAAGLPYLVALGSVAVSELVLLLAGNALLVRRFQGASTGPAPVDIDWRVKRARRLPCIEKKSGYWGATSGVP